MQNIPEEQIEFVDSLLNSVKEDIVKKIKAGKIPDNWDGIELRWYLAERFARETYGNKSRKREYNNTVLVNNL